MSEFRLWYPQLDVNDCIRRMLLILGTNSENSLYEERLHILDFYLANPSLLHRTHLPLELRKRVNELKIERPEKHFLSFPSPQILFARMEPLQSQAVRNLVAKGFVSVDAYRAGEVCLSKNRTVNPSTSRALFADEFEANIADFLANELAYLSRDMPGGLKGHTGLWRIGK